MDRRSFVRHAGGSALGLAVAPLAPAAEAPSALHDPRAYDLSVGIEIASQSDVGKIIAATPAPRQYPEQRLQIDPITSVKCQASLRSLGPGARQLRLVVDRLRAGERASATARFDVTLFRVCPTVEARDFPETQRLPAWTSEYLRASPEIPIASPAVKQLGRSLMRGRRHPWDQAFAFATWIPRHIAPREGPFTSVEAAIRDGKGDCEERSALFVALCRYAGIPARIVWAPNHNWAEMLLLDAKGVGHWLPVHTARYFWFGWTDIHALVLQKGDRVHSPELNRTERLMSDWTRSAGGRVSTRYVAELKPHQPLRAGDAPAWKKASDGYWRPTRA